MLEPLFYNTPDGREKVEALVNRRFVVAEGVEEKVESIISDVRASGDDALVRYARRYDSPAFTSDAIRVSESEIDAAYSDVDDGFPALVQRAVRNIREFHERQLPSSWMLTRENGAMLGQMVRPVDAAGLYVPGGSGGRTPLVSSVLMNALPAVIAGVKRIVMATPPDERAGVNPCLLVAAREAGVSEVYRMGSAWAIAAMAYGTETVAPVDVIAGPGNIFVTLAKKLVAGSVGIDMIAGPSEILVIADETAPARFAAADLLSQAEHDPMATSVLVTTSETVASETCLELDRLLAGLERAGTAKESLEANGVVLVVETLEQAVDMANRMGPEHLELLVADPWSLLPSIRHAGAIFLGRYSPEPIGDYMAGPNHVLPTMGTARFSSALGVETFLKRSSVISYSRKAFEDEAADVMALAGIEGLTAHSLSVDVRLDSGKE